MPTVPCRVGLLSSALPATGYAITATTRDDAISALVGRHATDRNAQMQMPIVYTATARDAGEVTADFPDASTAPLGTFIEGTITYPDDWHGAQITVEWRGTGRYFIGNIFGPYLSAKQLGSIAGGEWNGQAYHVTRDRETGFHSFGFTSNTMVKLVDGVLNSLDVELHFDWGGSLQNFPLEGAAFPDYPTSDTVPHTFATFGAAVTVYPVDEYGQRGPTITLRLPPIAKAVLVASQSPLFILNFAGSYDPDSGTATPHGVTGPDGDGYYTVDLGSYADTLDDDTAFNYPAMVVDAHDLSDSVPVALLVEAATQIGAEIDFTKTLYTVAPDADNPLHLRVRAFPAAGAIQPLHLLENARGGSLWASQRGELFLSAKMRGSGEYHVFRSRNLGRSFTQVSTSTMWGTTYKKGLDCGVPVGGGAASVATLTVDGTTKLLFKYSKDGINWPADGDAIEIASTATPADFKGIQIRQVPNSIELRVTNGISKEWRSLKLGKVDSWSVVH